MSINKRTSCITKQHKWDRVTKKRHLGRTVKLFTISIVHFQNINFMYLSNQFVLKYNIFQSNYYISPNLLTFCYKHINSIIQIFSIFNVQLGGTAHPLNVILLAVTKQLYDTVLWESLQSLLQDMLPILLQLSCSKVTRILSYFSTTHHIN